MGRLSTAVSQMHKKIRDQQRCDSTTREILLILPKMLQIEPGDRWSAKKARDQFKHILHRADMAMASRNRASQSVEAPVRQATTPSRSTTVSSDTSSPLSPHMNPRLSTAKEGTQRDTSAGASPKFDKILTQTPRNMTMDSDMDVNGAGSMDIGALVQQAMQNKTPDREVLSTPKHSPLLPDRTGQANGMGEPSSEKQPSALMSPFQDAGQISHNHLQSPQLDTSHQNRSTQSTPNPSAEAAAADHAGPDDQPLPAQNQETAIAPRPSTPPTPPARLSFHEALKWRKDAKAQRSAADLPNNHLLRFLEGRDHVSSKAINLPRTREYADRRSRYS